MAVSFPCSLSRFETGTGKKQVSLIQTLRKPAYTNMLNLRQYDVPNSKMVIAVIALKERNRPDYILSIQISLDDLLALI